VGGGGGDPAENGGPIADLPGVPMIFWGQDGKQKPFPLIHSPIGRGGGGARHHTHFIDFRTRKKAKKNPVLERNFGAVFLGRNPLGGNEIFKTRTEG